MNPWLMQGCRSGGAEGAVAPDQLTLSQPGGADFANQIILAPPDYQTFRRSCDVIFIIACRRSDTLVMLGVIKGSLKEMGFLLFVLNSTPCTPSSASSAYI